MRALRELLNVWDPIGVVGSAGPHDEYDCLIAPILDRLTDGAAPADLVAFLRRELADHFGLDPERHTAGVEDLSRRAVALRARGGERGPTPRS